jgi:phenylalanyl-tRNA synthetase alpha chain
MSDLAALEADLLRAVDDAADLSALESVRVGALGKSGSVSALLKTLGALSPEERRTRGPEINGLRDRVQAAISARRQILEDAALEARLAGERVDLSLPPPPRRKGSVHPTASRWRRVRTSRTTSTTSRR